MPYTMTDRAKIEAIILAKTPRPWKEVVMDVYPGATIDANGRAHAPYDGYECGLTGQLFKAGEFLPMSGTDENETYGFGGSVNYPVEAVDTEGNVHEFNGLTRAQKMAVYAELSEQSHAYDVARSNHLGTIGKKLTVNVTIAAVKQYEGYYGPVFFHVMKTDDGSIIIYKGGKKLGSRDKKYELTASVREHAVRFDVKQTLVQRPKVKEV